MKLEIQSNSPETEAIAKKFPGLSDGCDYALNRLFTNFVFADRKRDSDGKPVGKKREFICTTCYCVSDHVERIGKNYDGKIVVNPHLTHGELVVCPHCRTGAELKLVGKCGKMINLGQTRRALIIIPTGDPNLVFGVALIARKSYRYDGYREMHIHKHIEHIYAWTPGKAYCWRERWYMEDGNLGYSYREARTPSGVKGSEYIAQIIGLELLRHTFLRYSGLKELMKSRREKLADGDYAVRWLAEYCVHPGIEMIAKLGFHEIIEETLFIRKRGDGLINWSADKPWKFFRMDKQEYNEFVKGKPTLDRLKTRRMLRGFWSGSTIADADDELRRYGKFSDVSYKDYEFAAARLSPVLSRKQLANYIDRNARGEGSDFECATAAYMEWRALDYRRHKTLITFHDYYDMAEELGLDLTEPRVLMPKNLTAAHDSAVELRNTIRREEKERKEREADEKYRDERYDELNRRYSFADEHYFVRPPENAAEIINEGKALHHCVGGYAARHLEGKTTILFIRRTDAPDEPFFTVEMNIDSNWAKIRQIHGLHNRAPDKELDGFVDIWLDEIVERQTKRKEKRTHESKAS
jgi:hypothetical protein